MTVVDPREELSNRRLSKLNKAANGEEPNFAERLAAEVYGVRHDNSKSWYDARNMNTGTKYEAKSTQEELKNGATGRFRLWQEQHRRIAGAEGAEGQTAYYVFVVFDEDQPLRMRRMHPSTVTRILREHGDDSKAWHPSGHDSQGRQHKLPWTEVFSA